ncbi:MAG: acyl-CoA thioesterase [Verrucomicrobiales bacterium]
MSTGFHYHRALRFADTDMAGVGHFAAILTLVEEAWHAWLAKLGEAVHPAHAPEGAEPVGWPIVSITSDFRQPVHFQDEIRVLLSVERLGARSLRLRFTLEGPKGEFGSGSITTACTIQSDDGTWSARPIPASLAAKLTGAR